jgi:solute carrier family 25 phosphate transporter 23/24/25/41
MNFFIFVFLSNLQFFFCINRHFCILFTQVGALGGRVVYDNVIHVISAILEEQGPAGLYRGLGASWIKLIPAAGISLMCYEACKQILIEEEESNKQH